MPKHQQAATDALGGILSAPAPYEGEAPDHDPEKLSGQHDESNEFYLFPQATTPTPPAASQCDACGGIVASYYLNRDNKCDDCVADQKVEPGLKAQLPEYTPNGIKWPDGEIVLRDEILYVANPEEGKPTISLLNVVTADEAKLLAMSFRDGYGQDQIAVEFGVSQSTISRRLDDAFEKIDARCNVLIVFPEIVVEKAKLKHPEPEPEPASESEPEEAVDGDDGEDGEDSDRREDGSAPWVQERLAKFKNSGESYCGIKLPPCDGYTLLRMRWELRKIRERFPHDPSYLEDAIQEANTDYLAGKCPLKAVRRLRKRLDRYEQKHVGGDVAQFYFGEINSDDAWGGGMWD